MTGYFVTLKQPSKFTEQGRKCARCRQVKPITGAVVQADNTLYLLVTVQSDGTQKDIRDAVFCEDCFAKELAA